MGCAMFVLLIEALPVYAVATGRPLGPPFAVMLSQTDPHTPSVDLSSDGLAELPIRDTPQIATFSATRVALRRAGIANSVIRNE